jgi:hypothetical protein
MFIKSDIPKIYIQGKYGDLWVVGAAITVPALKDSTCPSNINTLALFEWRKVIPVELAGYRG